MIRAQEPPVNSRQTEQLQLANAVYASIAERLISHPEQFFAVSEGLAIATDAIDALLHSIPRSTAISAAVADGYLLRATHSYWLLLPRAFDCDDEFLPIGVRDHRGISVRTVLAAARAA
jgi:hypothetical protein